ncbi:MAG: hypothetical protein JSS63_09535 [Bacteroidetes bacterium]|nr:hypothetical protein [Bacteroidota bacterium]
MNIKKNGHSRARVNNDIAPLSTPKGKDILQELATLDRLSKIEQDVKSILEISTLLANNAVNKKSHQNLASIEKKFSGVKWNCSKDSLTTFETQLVINGCIERNERFVEYFYFDESVNFKNENENIPKIVWKKSQNKLVFLMDQLSDKGIVTFEGGRIHEITSRIFCKKDGAHYIPDNLSGSLYQVENHTNTEKSYEDLIEIVNYCLEKYH